MQAAAVNAALLGLPVLARSGLPVLTPAFAPLPSLVTFHQRIESHRQIDTVLWAAAAGFFHVVALLRFVSDELPVSLRSDDEEQM